MNQAEIIRMYDQWMAWPLLKRYYEDSSFLNVGYWDLGAKTQQEASEHLVAQLLMPLPEKRGRLLDVACGAGGTARYLANWFTPADIVGINLSPAQIECCRVVAPGSTFHVMDAATLDFPAASFDVVLCVEAAFHFDTRLRFLQEALRVLKPGGWLVLSDMLFGASGILENRMVPEENRVAGVAAYRKAYEQAGFQRVAIQDATTACWTGYGNNLLRWLQGEERQGRLSAAERTAVAHRLTALTVDHYLLISAEKPS